MGWRTILDRIWRGILLTVCALGAGVVVLLVALPGIGSHDPPPGRARCNDNLQQLAVALLNYMVNQGHFPAVGVSVCNGAPVKSWRVAILPYLGQKGIFDKYDPKQPWDSLNNREIAGSMPEIFRCPDDPAATQTTEQTSYLMIAGRGGLGGLDGKARGLDTVPSPGTTILLIEVPGSGVHWMDPRDLSIDEVIARLKKKERGGHPGLLLVAFCDGHVDTMSDANIERALPGLANPDKQKSHEIAPPTGAP